MQLMQPMQLVENFFMHRNKSIKLGVQTVNLFWILFTTIIAFWKDCSTKVRYANIKIAVKCWCATQYGY